MGELLIESMPGKLSYALDILDRVEENKDVLYHDEDYIKILEEVECALEVSVMEILSNDKTGDNLKIMRKCATNASRILMVLPSNGYYRKAFSRFLNMASLSVVGGQFHIISETLRDIDWPCLSLDSDNWGIMSFGTIVDSWLRLISGECSAGRELVKYRIQKLRRNQKKYEKKYFYGVKGDRNKRFAALELISLYHLAKAAERMAGIIDDIDTGDISDTRDLVDMNFNHAISACDADRMLDLGPMTILLKACALQMIETICKENNAIGTV
jgi:hypothetical protein